MPSGTKKLILAAKNNGMETFYLISFLMDGACLATKNHNTVKSVLQMGPLLAVFGLRRSEKLKLSK